MTISRFSLAVASTLALPLTALAAPPTLVFDAESLRDALANGDSKIVIQGGTGVIDIDETLEYSGTDLLTIKGNGAEIVYTGPKEDSGPILFLSAGADLSITNLSLRGQGGFNINEQGGGKGIFVQVPSDREGVVSVKLTKVSVFGTGNHGVIVSDCSLGDDCGAGQGGGGDGSDASVWVVIKSVTVDCFGFGKQDADGVRVDDRGAGDIVFTAVNSSFVNVGADGVELDEGNEGSVQVSARNLTFDSNGAYCDPEILEPLLEEFLNGQADEAEFAKGERFPEELAGPVTGTPDDICIEYEIDLYDDGSVEAYEYGIDVDDAFDIDEDGPGGIFGMLTNLTIVDNLDEGLDFDTAGSEGDNAVDLSIARVEASGNGDEAIKVSEEGNASVYVDLRALRIEGDVEVEEENDGDLAVTISGSRIGDDLKLSEEDAGAGTAALNGTTVVDEKDFNNVLEI